MFPANAAEWNHSSTIDLTARLTNHSCPAPFLSRPAGLVLLLKWSQYCHSDQVPFLYHHQLLSWFLPVSVIVASKGLVILLKLDGA